MRVTMEYAQRLTLVEMREFVASSGSLSFTGAEHKQIHRLVERTRQVHEYRRRSRQDRASCGAIWPRSPGAAWRGSRG